MQAVQTQVSPDHPIDRMLTAFPNARPCGNNGWYSVKCSAHNDHNASLSFREDDDGGIIIKCHAGCERRAILEAAGLTWKDLSPRNGYKPAYVSRPKLDLIELAADKMLHWKFLFQLGLDDEYSWHGSKVVKIPYYLESGEEHTKTRVRIGLSGNKGSFWDEDTPGEMIPYGLNKLDIARKERYLLIGEGESDAWTCWAYGIPYLGVPGATNEKCLDGKVLADIPRIYIIQEPDKAGQGFYKRVHGRLRATSYKGELYALPFKKLTGCKDPNALHKHLKGQGFKEKIAEALRNAITSGDEIDRARKPKPQAVLLRDLQKKTYPDVKWSVPDILPEGLTWLCGKPKLGKSWLLLAMMCAIACGGVALGNIPVEEGEVLYLSLEDTERRLVSRANTVLENLEASPNFYCQTSWPRMNDGGLEALEEWLQAHPKARLIGIDTWGKFKPTTHSGNKQQYDEDYEAITPLQELAGKYNVSIVLVYHMRKQESDDPLDMVTGSVALAGAVDGFLLLYRKRGENDARLFVTGRDIEEEQELMLSFKQETASWIIKGNADENAGTPEQQAILNELKKYPNGIGGKVLADKLKKNYSTLRNLLVKLRNDGKVILANNVYRVVTVVNQGQDTQQSNLPKEPDKPIDTQSENESSLTTVTSQRSHHSQTIVTHSQTVNQPDKPIDTPIERDLTTVTTMTTQSERFVL